jgi:hypothetical protein
MKQLDDIITDFKEEINSLSAVANVGRLLKILSDLRTLRDEQRKEIFDFMVWFFKRRPDDYSEIAIKSEIDTYLTHKDELRSENDEVAAGVRFSEERKMKNILIELGDEELKLVSQKELDEIIKSDEEFDGFHGWTLKGRLATNDNTAELKPSLYLRNALLGVKYEYERIMKAHNSGNAIVTDDERDNMKNDLLILNELL